MRKTVLISILILLVFLSGCNDLSVGESSDDKQAVEVSTFTRGEILSAGDPVELEFTVDEETPDPDRLELRITDAWGNVVKEKIIEESPLTEYLTPFAIDDSFPQGMYSLSLDFYSLDEAVYSETREFFVSDSGYLIKSINSYPPVLYPGGGGLFSADTDCSGGDSCWYRWKLNGGTIAEGLGSNGLKNIEITAPGSEGVYSLSLELFPFPPAEGGDYKFESTIVKTVPVYVNTDQKAGINEFVPDEDFFALFHFRGNLHNSAPVENSGIEKLQPFGAPQLSVRGGILGYYLSYGSGFETDSMMIPVGENMLQGFSVMLSMIPYTNGYAGELLSTGSVGGEVAVTIEALEDGRLSGNISAGGMNYSLLTEESFLIPYRYTSVSFAVAPSEENLRLLWFSDGVPDSEITYTPGDGEIAPWYNIDTEGLEYRTELSAMSGFECLVDEFGIYYQDSADTSVDPDQYRRSMELEYGNTLVYAEGFDGIPEELVFDQEKISVKESNMIIGAGGVVDFPAVYPGYEELVFQIQTSGEGAESLKIDIYTDGGLSEVTSIDVSPELVTDGGISFSLLFSSESVSVKAPDGSETETDFMGDFSGIGYSLTNSDRENPVIIKNILITRKSISVPEEQEKVAGAPVRVDIGPAVNISR